VCVVFIWKVFVFTIGWSVVMVTCFDVGGGFLITASSSRVFVCTFLFSIFGALCMYVAVCLSIVCTFMSYWKLLYVLYKYKIFSLRPIWAHNLWNKAAEAYALIKAPSTPICVCTVYTIQHLFVRFTWLHSTWLAFQLPLSSVFCLLTTALLARVRGQKVNTVSQDPQVPESLLLRR